MKRFKSWAPVCGVRLDYLSTPHIFCFYPHQLSCTIYCIILQALADEVQMMSLPSPYVKSCHFRHEYCHWGTPLFSHNSLLIHSIFSKLWCTLAPDIIYIVLDPKIFYLSLYRTIVSFHSAFGQAFESILFCAIYILIIMSSDSSWRTHRTGMRFKTFIHLHWCVTSVSKKVQNAWHWWEGGMW